MGVWLWRERSAWQYWGSGTDTVREEVFRFILFEGLAKATATAPHAYCGSSTRRAFPRRAATRRVCRANTAEPGQEGHLPAGGQSAPRQRGGDYQPASGLAAVPALKLGRRSRALPAGGPPSRDPLQLRYFVFGLQFVHGESNKLPGTTNQRITCRRFC